jgi:hypothetical protein
MSLQVKAFDTLIIISTQVYCVCFVLRQTVIFGFYKVEHASDFIAFYAFPVPSCQTANHWLIGLDISSNSIVTFIDIFLPKHFYGANKLW